MVSIHRDCSLQTEGDTTFRQINFTDKDGKLDKEKFYAYLKTKPKGVKGISSKVERLVLYRARKHQWNTDIKLKRRRLV